MSLSKIPLIIGVCYAYKVCMTPPNPPPPDEERLEKGGPPAWFVHSVLKLATSLQFLAGLLETLTILAHNYPASPLSTSFLSVFILRGGDAGALRTSLPTTTGGVLLILGTLLRLATFRALGPLFRFEASIQAEHRLVTRGPYAVVRHPSYSAALLLHPGWFLWHFGRGSWVLESGLWGTVAGKLVVGSVAGFVMGGVLWVVLPRMKEEDRALKRRFGREWDEYAGRVRYSLVPGVY